MRFRFRKNTILTGAIVCLLLSTGLAAPNGEALYGEHCSACHQDKGKGGIGLPLTRSKLAHVSDDYVLKTIRLGRPGRIMPSFDHLSDAQAKAIVRHIRSWYSEPGMQFSQQPVKGDIEKGKTIYQVHCVKCHGADGSGEGEGTGVTLSRQRNFMIMPPAINNPGFLQAASDAMIKHTIETGREGSIMPAFKSTLDAGEINDVVAYVRTFSAQESKVAQSREKPRAAYVVESPYDFDTTVENIKAALTGANFRIFPPRFVEQGLIDEFSHNTKQVSIRFCNFRELYSMLNIEPRLGTVLPCRITVIEDKSGKVKMVSANVSAIAYWFNNDELIELGEAMEGIIMDVMEEATL